MKKRLGAVRLQDEIHSVVKDKGGLNGLTIIEILNLLTARGKAPNSKNQYNIIYTTCMRMIEGSINFEKVGKNGAGSIAFRVKEKA